MTTHRAYFARDGLTDWTREVLDLRLSAMLSTVRPDGSPHTVPVGYAFDGQRFLIGSGSTTGKVRNVETNPRARVLVEAPAAVTGQDDGWVAADGSAHLIRGAEAQELNAAAAGRYLTEEGKTGFGQVFLPLMDVTIVVVPERWQSWNESGMHATMAEHGYAPEDAVRWYLPLDA